MNPLATMTAAEYNYVTARLAAEGYTLDGNQTAANARAASLLAMYRDDDFNHDGHRNPVPVPLPTYFH